MINVEIKSQCCGCRACEQICNQGAIVMKEDQEGFLFPIIDTYLCVDCGLCEKTCPIINANSTLNGGVKVFAAQNNNKMVLKKSSSGGVFSLIALKILEQGGVVYGAAFDENMILSHVRVTEAQELS